MSSDTVSQIASISAGTVVRPAAHVKLTSAQENNVAAGGKDMPLPTGTDPAGRKKLAEAVSELNSYVQNVQRDLQFSIDDESGRTIIKVIDSESNQVIRQIPPEEVLNLARKLDGGEATAMLKVKA